VRAALRTKGHEISLADMRKVLVKAADKIKHQARGDIRRKAVDVNRFCGKPEQLDDNAVEADVDQWFDALKLKEATILKVFPGKELMTALRDVLKGETGIDLRVSDLMQAITPLRIAPDLTKTLKAVAEAHNT
jgi:hypothetical protein